MQTQRDHLNAYQFMMGRMSSALVLADPASPEIPARRAIVGMIVGVLLAVLIAIGFVAYGAIVPGGNRDWQAKGATVVEKETGIMLVNVDGRLHPTLNYASAKLLGNNSKVAMVSKASMKDAPRGSVLGIPNAPQALPSAQDIGGSSWLTCLPGSWDDSVSADRAPNVLFDPVVPSVPLPDERYLLVKSAAGSQYVVWRGMKFKVDDPIVTVALGMATARPVPAPQAWLNALVDGPALAPAAIDRAGTPGSPVGGQPRKVGQLFEHQAGNGDTEWFVLRADGIAPVSATEFALLAASTGSQPVRVDTAAIASAPRSSDQSLLKRLPDLSRSRWLDHGQNALCLRQTPVGAQVESQIAIAAGGALAGNSVQVRPGAGVIVGALPVPAGRKVPDRYLITDEGRKYLMPDDESIKALGLAGAPVRPMAGDMLAGVPSGPVLSKAAAAASEKG
ncbi:type VII secretion protein EccB [Actinosynnema sp. ALI-1.44]|uniref:type VII secretion protein EccB n=1 Tax=Actinosynnema sp. ALI-1.44 TaxID=1933779 RepID=UPI00097C0582|nr:type VII secretion protein EccB [Actinosynnema sp. ALI-1.44]ONI83113.1 type VII secretion protein EccB [Actinosynnema sp. ALI-1.44]